MITEGKEMAAEALCQEDFETLCVCVLDAHEGYHQCSCGYEWLTPGPERTDCGHDPDLVCAECIEETVEVTC